WMDVLRLELLFLPFRSTNPLYYFQPMAKEFSFTVGRPPILSVQSIDIAALHKKKAHPMQKLHWSGSLHFLFSHKCRFWCAADGTYPIVRQFLERSIRI